MAYPRLRLPQAETARPRLFQELLNPEFPENKKFRAFTRNLNRRSQRIRTLEPFTRLTP